jgi:hypothetical protein
MPSRSEKGGRRSRKFRTRKLRTRKLRTRKLRTRKGGNGPNSSSTSENYTNENIDKLLSLLTEFAFISDEDIKKNPKYKRFRAEREKTIEEITAILTNPNFNISLISDIYKKRALLTSIVSANDTIINLYADLYADLYGYSENTPEMNKIFNDVKNMFKMNAEPYERDEDDDSDDEARNIKAVAEATKKYEKLIELINKIKSKHVADTALTIASLEQNGNRLPDPAIKNVLEF